jgi:hypothetical protein
MDTEKVDTWKCCILDLTRVSKIAFIVKLDKNSKEFEKKISKRGVQYRSKE